ncbi:hypothetical protein DCCM_0949 [Desulfocucumis palustris]|uniref:Uncharacterized protein n=1 Tax=Desulfocucumis palustris TaxID=1898651 RepID=A0A2L2XAR9_9FIRM|nr:hypothetical protein DCCM_0949 [Desulfocucumis palustris]
MFSSHPAPVKVMYISTLSNNLICFLLLPSSLTGCLLGL